jgi:hypothetical protein
LLAVIEPPASPFRQLHRRFFYSLPCGRFEICHSAAKEAAAAAMAAFEESAACVLNRSCLGRNIGCWDAGSAPPFRLIKEPSKSCFQWFLSGCWGGLRVMAFDFSVDQYRFYRYGRQAAIL